MEQGETNMVQQGKFLAAEVVAFDKAADEIMRVHRRHTSVLTEGQPLDAPHSRRALYNALKDYRRAETALYHAAGGEKQSRPAGGNEDVVVRAIAANQECNKNNT